MKRKRVMTFSILGFLLLFAVVSAVFALESGSLTSISLAKFDGDWIFSGNEVAGVGDINGDGYSDMLVQTNYLYADPILGGPSSWSLGKTLGQSPMIRFTVPGLTSMAGAGDINNDGYDDMLLGVPSNNSSAGAAFLILGNPMPTSGDISTAVTYSGESAGDLAGMSVAAGGDVNGDGYADMLIGANFHNSTGAAYLVAGESLNNRNESYKERRSLSSGDDTPTIYFEQLGVWVNFISNAHQGSDINVTRHLFHPCSTNQKLATPIWTVESAKLDASSQVSLQFKYNDNNIAGMNEANLKLWTRPSGQICADWIQVTGSTVDANTNRISASGLTGLGQFTIADSPPEPTAIESGSINASSNPGMLSSVLGLVVMLGAGSGMALWRYRQERIR